MQAAIFLFWTCLGILFFCYIGYGLLLGLMNLFISRNKVNKHDVIPVTLIISAYNESEILLQKIRNTLDINYPAELLKVIVITDGSSDETPAMLSGYPFIQHLHQDERRGKMAAIKRAMREVNTPVVIFSDANTMLNPECIHKIIRHYHDPGVGGVAGEKKIITDKISAVGQAEGIYWKYESLMKKLDASFNTVVGAAGELFSIRTSLFKSPDDEIILDDFFISMEVCLQGYKIAYEPGAFATEYPSASIFEEEKRKIRISAGAYQSIQFLRPALNCIKFPLLAFQFISRRLIRWLFSPFLLVGVFSFNLVIVNNIQGFGFYSWTMIAQCLFYLLAFMGWLMIRKEKPAGWLSVPFYFVFMNYCQLRGLILFLQRKQTVLWEKSIRQEMKSVSN